MTVDDVTESPCGDNAGIVVGGLDDSLVELDILDHAQGVELAEESGIAVGSGIDGEAGEGVAVAVEGSGKLVSPVGADRFKAIVGHIDVVLHTENLTQERTGVLGIGAVGGFLAVDLVGEENEVVESLQFVRVGFGAFAFKRSNFKFRIGDIEVGLYLAFLHGTQIVLGAEHGPSTP